MADTLVAGRYCEEALAALSVGSAVYISVFVAMMGMLQALLPTWAELHGGSRHAEVLGAAAGAEVRRRRPPAARGSGALAEDSLAAGVRVTLARPRRD